MASRMRTRTLLLVMAIGLAACGGDDGLPPPKVAPPQAGAGDDVRFAVDGFQPWYLIGNDLTAGDPAIAVTVRVDHPELVVEGVETVDVWVAGGPGQRLTRDPATGQFTGTLDISALPPGEHEVLFAADGKDLAFARRTFKRTHPMYFMLTTDWDFADPGDNSLLYHDRIREMHPDVKFTHFVGPYTYTDPEVTEARRTALTSWLTARRDQHGDEIGLHIHPWCHFVRSAGLTCITNLSTVYPTDETGYTIKMEAYGQAGFETLLTRADEIFTSRGLGKPVTFRAGAWTATNDTLKALAAKGFVADTSAANWMRLEEWEGQQSGELFRWNMTNWSSIGDTSQPYYPNVSDKLSAAAPVIPILEVPDNAIMVDYVTRTEMIEIFAKNWDGTPLTKPTMYMMGFHPAPSMDVNEFYRIDGILDHADQFLASKHAGPVVYGVLKDMPKVWPRP